MTTLYNIQIIAAHPEMMPDAPDASMISDAIHASFVAIGLAPIAAQVERNDDDAETGLQFESKAWIPALPAALLLSVANYFDEQLAARSNPEAVTWDHRFIGFDLPFSMADLAKVIVEERAS